MSNRFFEAEHDGVQILKGHATRIFVAARQFVQIMAAAGPADGIDVFA
ncbi:hypothetical protein EWM64_g5747 [Hericium alpestre]|uniref:Uncharacterized protein n=1 Tax=Hericium alpestre TaxID=135208 RepID=A0A4Y9ZVH5_9AGAM|nr:hypothetical protein EWM64_g5747 [Hericium alpestre]